MLADQLARIQTFTKFAVAIPVLIFIGATVTPVPMAFRHVVPIVTEAVVHQIRVVAAVKLRFQASAVGAVLVPVGVVVVATISSVP